MLIKDLIEQLQELETDGVSEVFSENGFDIRLKIVTGDSYPGDWELPQGEFAMIKELN